jgi:hypothetical protein
MYVYYCAAEAIFCCPTENTHHLEALLISKNPLFNEEKISVRRTARCHITSVQFAGATFTRRIDSREGCGEGGVICETMPFDNGSSDRLQIQHEDSQKHSAPLLFRQDLSNSYW